MTDIYRPPVHLVQYGDAYSGKSIAAASFWVDGPMLVLMFDNPGKESPYVRVGSAIQYAKDGNMAVLDAEGQQIIQIEFYHDYNPEHPVAWAAFRQRVATMYTELDKWATIVVDSMTQAETCARYESQYKLNPAAKDPRRHYGYSTEEIERLIMVRLGGLPCNVIVNCHIDEHVVFDDKEGDQGIRAVKDEVHGIMMRNPSAPGRMKKHLPAGYNCLFRTYKEQGRSGLWQTDIGGGWNAGSQIVHIQSPVPAEYESLWKEEYQL